jgi:hypothetical protein
MRSPDVIRAELDELMERRTALWKELSLGHDAAKVADCRRLAEEIDELWLELRFSAVTERFGPRERVLARARAEARLEDELNRRIAGRPRTRARRVAASA